MAGTLRFAIEVGSIPDDVVVRFPSADNPDEREFIAAAAESRERARCRLADRVPGIDWATMARTTDGLSLMVTRAGPGLLDSLDVPAMLDEMGRHQAPGGGRFELTGGPMVADAGLARMPLPARAMYASPYPLLVDDVDPGVTAGLVRDGHTLVLNHIEHLWQPFQDFTGDLRTYFACASDINAYASFGGAEGFGAHWDDHEALVLQVEGHKYWEIYAPTTLSPVKGHVTNTVGEQLVWSGVLEPGSVLLIPRGWGHRVESEPELSLHVTIGVNRFRTLDILRHLTHEAGNWPTLRSDVPVDLAAPDAPQSYAGSVFDEPAALEASVIPLLPGAVERATARYRARLAPYPMGSLVHSLRGVTSGQWSGLQFEVPYRSGIMIADIDDEETLSLACGGHVFRVDRSMGRLVAAAAAGSPLSLEELRSRVGWSDDPGVLEAVVGGLVESGLFQATALVGPDGEQR